MKKMEEEDRIKCFNEVQKLRDRVEATQFVLGDIEDDAVKSYLESIWVETQSLLDYLM